MWKCVRRDATSFTHPSRVLACVVVYMCICVCVFPTPYLPCSSVCTCVHNTCACVRVHVYMTCSSTHPPTHPQTHIHICIRRPPPSPPSTLPSSWALRPSCTDSILVRRSFSLLVTSTKPWDNSSTCGSGCACLFVQLVGNQHQALGQLINLWEWVCVFVCSACLCSQESLETTHQPVGMGVRVCLFSLFVFTAPSLETDHQQCVWM